MHYRIETDSLGEVQVDAKRYYGAQTARALEHFDIAGHTMPRDVIHAYGLIKGAAAEANAELGSLPRDMAALIGQAAGEVAGGKLDEHFPLGVWQSGSGTQTNMNVNEVIANRAIELAGGTLGSKDPVHPNDHVNRSQSTNDTFPAAMHVATVIAAHKRLFPSLDLLCESLHKKQREFSRIVKIGRTHLMDAVPVTFGQEFSGYAAQLDRARRQLVCALDELHHLPLGATAVGTGLNAPGGFGRIAAGKIAATTGLPFVPAINSFAALAAHDSLVSFSGALKALAVALTKIANDIRWLGSGPRCGIGELHLPANEPGSSIMPGKVNPSQCEALLMLCARVVGNDTTVSIAGASGSFELNVCKPLIIHTVLESLGLLGDGMDRFARYCIDGLAVDRQVVDDYVEQSLMLVTALASSLGYDNAAKIAQRAWENRCSLREAALESGMISAEEYDRQVRPETMTGENLQ